AVGSGEHEVELHVVRLLLRLQLGRELRRGRGLELDAAHVFRVLLPVVLDGGLRKLQLSGDVDDREADRARRQGGQRRGGGRARRGRGGRAAGRTARAARGGERESARAHEELPAIKLELARSRRQISVAVHFAPPADVKSAHARRNGSRSPAGDARRLTDLTSRCNISCAFAGQGRWNG